MNTLRKLLLLLTGLIIGLAGATAGSKLLQDRDIPASDSSDAGVVIGSDDSLSFAEVMKAAAERRVLYIGEIHDRADHHRNQLKVIEEMRLKNHDFAIGVEFFQRPHQGHVDAYLSGLTNEKTLLKRTGYYRNWGYDYRLYRPIVEYAKSYQIPLIALNAPTTLVQKVSRHGFEGLEPELKDQLPDIVMEPGPYYVSRLRQVFNHHAGGDTRFERFLQVQLLWDEYMAESVSAFLRENPYSQIVVLAGSGHVAGGMGIPERVYRRSGQDFLVFLTKDSGTKLFAGADFYLASENSPMERNGALGWRVGEDEDGVYIRDHMKMAPGRKEVVSKGDRLMLIAGEPIRSIEDFRLAMLDRLPGEHVWVELLQTRPDTSTRRISVIVRLI